MKENIKDDYRNLLKFLENNHNSFTPIQKKIVDYIISHLEETSYLTSDELASKINTTPSSIVRFCKKIGFNGYPELQKNLRKFVLDKINSFSPVEKAKKVPIPNFETIITSSLLTEIENLKELLKPEYQIEKCINRFINDLLSSKKIYVIANRASFGLAYTFWYYSKKTIDNIFLLNDFGGSIFDSLRELNKDTLVIAISFPNYSRVTLNFCKFAKEMNIKIVSITDRNKSPLCEISSYCIFAPISSLGYHTSRVAAEAIINAVISKIFIRKKKQTIKNLEIEDRIKERYF